MDIQKELWGTCKCGKEILRYTLKNSSGAFVRLSSIGAGITEIHVPDKDGKIEDVVLGYKDPMDYFADGPCAGKTPGRYANRIAKGKFTLDGVEYTLPINNGPNHLHGGPEGFNNQVWDSRINGDTVEFMYFSKDGEQGYPGNLKVVVSYSWSEDNVLTIIYTGETDAPTIVNLTNHSYFNLNGDGNGNILGHELKLNASTFLPTDETLIPFGEPDPVAGTPMDFLTPKQIGKDIMDDFKPLVIGKGYDHNFIIDAWEDGQLQTAAELYSPKSGRVLEIQTTQPGIQVYTGNYLGGSPVSKCGRPYEDYEGVAMECQHFPDSPNKPDYPGTVLRPGETYKQAIIYSFSVK